MARVIGILSLKGGVGKTSVVASLGSAIGNFNKKVLLVDGNFSAPNLGFQLNVLDPEVTLHHVLNRKAHMRDAIYRAGKVDMVPSSVFGEPQINPMKLRDVLTNVRRSYDIIILDSSPALNEETLAVMNASDELFVVTTPDYPTMSMTLKAIKLAKQRGVPINGLIINKVHNRNFELSSGDIEKTAEVPVMAVIPYDLNMLRALSNFTPSVDYKQNSEGSEEFRKLAAVLVGEKQKQQGLRGFFRWVVPTRQDINRTIFYEAVFG